MLKARIALLLDVYPQVWFDSPRARQVDLADSASTVRMTERRSSPPARALQHAMGMSPYIRRLRARVGHERLLIAAVTVLVWDPDGRLLLAQDSDSGLWMTIAGAIELDESPREAAVREAREEAGIEVALDRLRGTYAGPQLRHTYPNGDEASFVSIVYDAHVCSGTPHPDGEEVSTLAWCDPAAPTVMLMRYTGALLAAAGVLPGGSDAVGEVRRPP
jgi:8-oxo-dGTP pyrophosphatase MutT (NUDIX family)